MNIIRGITVHILCALATPCGLAGATTHPNVIIFNTDDHAQRAVGAYGNKEIHTPNMDRLAREGMRFDRAFSKPVCSPSRAMTLTGLYSHRVGIPDYIPYVNPVHADNGLPAGTPTIASVLKPTGYTSALIGKWHLGYGEKYYPEHFGFEVVEGHPYVAPGKKYDGLASLPSIVDGKEIMDFKNKRQTDILTERAIHFIREHRAKPFFLFFNPFVTHQGYWSTVPDEDLARYADRPLTVPKLPRVPGVQMDEAGLRRLTSIFYGAVTCADRSLGRLLATLDDLNLTQNTIVLFMADNGMNLGHLALIGKGNANILGSNPRVHRPNMFDRSVLVPFVVRWPGVVKAGTTSDKLVSTIDILPTLIEVTGAAQGQELRLDGRSLLPLLKNQDASWRSDYSDTYDMIYHAESHMRMLRTDRWKLVRHFDAHGNALADGSRHELYDLKSDSAESANLYGKAEAAEIQRQLDSRLRAWMREAGVTK